MHGWPSSFWEFHRVLDLFINEYKDQSLDIIIPSLPGYGFSEYPMEYTGFTTAIAEIFRDLIESLNYNNYVLVGGDWGSIIAHNMAYSVVQDTDRGGKQKLQGIFFQLPLGSPPPHELLLLALNMDFVHKYIADKYAVSVERVKTYIIHFE